MSKPDAKSKPQVRPVVSPATPSIQPHRLPIWRFWIPLAAQLMLLVSVPAQSAYTYLTGETIVLQTAPVDPYDFLRGYYQTLNYQISDRQQLLSLPGGEEVLGDTNQTRFYLVLEAPEEASGNAEVHPWQPVRVSAMRPDDLA
ncbi:MAG: GDYXXLXY domain-containing protein, partial [Leptolyngbya sp. SIO1D8]|nr:GDYXXLXY domain-containing protein [Leptolyngbya sp. SIO1D8]